MAEVFLVIGGDQTPKIVAKGLIKTNPLAFDIDWIHERHTKLTEKYVAEFVFPFLFGLFFLQHPKTIHVEQSEPAGPKLQKAREKRGKPPLITYRRIHLLFGQKTVRHYPNCQNGFGEEHYGHRRYHRVEGHWRRLHWDDPQRQCVVFVQEHYRGDPAIGMSLTERHVHGGPPL